MSGFGNIGPWWRLPFRVVAHWELESLGRNYDLRAPVRPQVKQEASTPWLLHPCRRFDASKQRVSSWTVGIWTDDGHAGGEEGSSIRHPQAPRRTTCHGWGRPMRFDREPRFGSHGSTVPLFPWFRKQHSDSHLFVLARALPLSSHRVQPRRRACGCWARELMMHTLDRGVPRQEHAPLALATGSQPRRPLALSSHLRWQRWSAARRRPELKPFVVHPFAVDASLWRQTGA
jgi:hypothetical protein